MKLLDYMKKYQEFDIQINELEKELEKIKDNVSDIVIETLNERIGKLQKEKQKFGNQTLYTESDYENQRLWNK